MTTTTKRIEPPVRGISKRKMENAAERWLEIFTNAYLGLIDGDSDARFAEL